MIEDMWPQLALLGTALSYIVTWFSWPFHARFQVELIKRLAEEQGQLIINELERTEFEDHKEIDRRKTSFETAIVSMETFTSYSAEVRINGRHSEVVTMSKSLHERAVKIKVSSSKVYFGQSYISRPGRMST